MNLFRNMMREEETEDKDQKFNPKHLMTHCGRASINRKEDSNLRTEIRGRRSARVRRIIRQMPEKGASEGVETGRNQRSEIGSSRRKPQTSNFKPETIYMFNEVYILPA